jgi:hypothetical protein
VDKEGNESSFSENTFYEVRVDTGCSAGQLLTTEGLGEYFKNVTMPIKFVVNDSLAVEDTLISVKVGVEGNDGNVYVTNKKASGEEAKAAYKNLNTCGVKEW